MLPRVDAIDYENPIVTSVVAPLVSRAATLELARLIPGGVLALDDPFREAFRERRPPQGALITMLILATLAGAVAAYLTVQSAILGGSPIGCGSGSGCAAVLSSKWSKVLGLPISAFATLIYVVVIVLLVATRGKSPAEARGAWSVLVFLATAISAAAVWFIFLQAVRIGSYCAYCMFDHACGVALSVMLFSRAFPGAGGASSRGRSGLGAARSMPAVVLAVCAVGLLAFVQRGSSETVHRIALPIDRDFDLREGDDRRIGVLGGQLHFSVEAESLLGSADAGQILAVLYDYCCPHCRHTHELLRRALEKGGNKFAVLALPLPMNRECNPHAPEEMPERFRHSCELVKIALAVRFGAPERFAEFDGWLYEPENPREPKEARRQADRILDGRLEAALSDARVEQTLKRNIDAFSASGADRVPVIFGPWVEPIVGRVEEEQTLARILDDIPRGAAKARK